MNNYIAKRLEKLINSKEKIIKEYDDKIKKLDEYINILNNCEIKNNDNFETIVYKLYMQLDNVSFVAKEINKLGYRVITESWQGKRKYSSNDITFIITDNNANVDEKLKEVVQEIQRVNYGKSSKRWF